MSVAISLAAARSAAAEDGPLLNAPIWVYNNWSAYDELSDEVPLDEALAMRELAELLRLTHAGVRFDYYMMDAFWYDPDAGYRKWRADRWPNWPDAWIAACLANGIKPGLWFSTNTLAHMHAAGAWRSSLDERDYAMAMYKGGFLADFMDVLEYWWQRGIRMFKFDFADFDAAAKGDAARLTPAQIRARNEQALHAALRQFRARHPDAVLVGFNGFVGDVETGKALRRSARAAHWLDVFDTLYSGDPRPSNVPQMDFWRSVDIYGDHMVLSLEQTGVPLSRIDSTSFMIGDTATNYRRRNQAWRSSLLLMLAHGGWISTVHGNLEFLDADDIRWLAKAQGLYAPLHRHGATRSFAQLGAVAQPYGFVASNDAAALVTVVNPAQAVRWVALPALSPLQQQPGRILFRDAGFRPALTSNAIRLGPGQLAVIGYGRYSRPEDGLGLETQIRVPRRITPIPAAFGPDGDPPAISATVPPPRERDLRIVLQQRDAAGTPVRSFSRQPMGAFFRITAEQNGTPLPVETRYGLAVWSGLSWGVGEIRRADMTPGIPLHIRLSAAETDPTLHLEGSLYAVDHGRGRFHPHTQDRDGEATQR